MQNNILEKLTRELSNGITTEAQTVYLLVQLRKLIEHNSKKNFNTIKMFCDWALHIELTRNRQIIELLKEFDETIEREKNGYGPTKHDYLSLKKFKEAMKDFLTEFSLPKDILKSAEWSTFIRLYISVVSDCPVTNKDYAFKFIKEISMSNWQAEDAPPEYLKQREGFYLQWRVIKKDGTHINWEVIGEPG
ncbi:MAG: hypothetical protein KAR13_03705 [Desulfobulbaceae bacterium]|nr:hypothetical protein [Desulfobulbaceae bacterium]